MLATPLRRAIGLTAAVAGVLATLVWGVGVILAPDRLVRRLRFPGHVWEMGFSPDGRILVAAGRSWVEPPIPQGTAVAWDTRNWAVVKTIPGAINLCGFSSDGTRLLVQTLDAQAALWDIRRWKAIRHFRIEKGVGSKWVLSPDGKRVAVLDHDKARLTVRDLRRDQLRSFSPILGAYLVAFAPDSRQLAYFADTWDHGPKGGITVIDTTTDAPPRKLGNITLGFSPDGNVAVGVNSSTITLWNPKTWTTLRSFPGPGQDYVGRVSVSRDGRIIAINTTYGAWIYDAATGWELARFPGNPEMGNICLSPDGDQVAVPTNSEVQVWEIGSRDRLMARALFRRLTGRR